MSHNWQLLRLQEGDKSFSFRSSIGEFHGRVYQGAMKGDVYWGLKALVPELWACRERVVYDWEIRVPKLRGSEKNTGIGRRLLNFWSQSAAPFALLFEEYVPPELISDLERAYGFRVRNQYQVQKGEHNEEPARDPELHHAEADAGRRQGGSDDREGDASALGDGEDPGSHGLEEAVAPRVRRPYKRRKPAKARRKK